MLVLFAMLCVVKAEESSIMGSTTVVRDAISYPWNWCPDPDVFVKGGFKHFIHSDAVNIIHEFKVDLG